MSTLQISLAIIGGLVLALVIAYNTWTSRRNTPRQPQPEVHDTEPLDTVADPERSERQDPGFDGPLAASADASRDPVTGVVIPPPDKKPGLDPLIDTIAPITPESAVSGDAALAAMPPTRRAGSKPFAIEGLNDATQHWETPALGQRYSQFQAGVQLANRTGALNDIEYSEFVVKAQAFADTINATAEFPEMREEVARARELDQFASDHDAQLSFTLRAVNAAWSPGYVQQHAARLGFMPGVIPGRMVLPTATPGLPSVLGLAFDTQAALAEDPDQSAIRAVTLSLDVPLVHRSERPFVRLRECAAALAEAMDGVVTDDRGQLLHPEPLDGIGADLETLYDKLDSRDLSAGSALARRLFS